MNDVSYQGRKRRIPSHRLSPKAVRNRAYVTHLPLLRREMILQRTKGRWARIERDAGPLGVGIRLPDRSLVVMTEVHVPYFRAPRMAKKQAPRYPAKVWWQERFLLLLKEPRRLRHARKTGNA
jgi:hypothetical protein